MELINSEKAHIFYFYRAEHSVVTTVDGVFVVGGGRSVKHEFI